MRRNRIDAQPRLNQLATMGCSRLGLRHPSFQCQCVVEGIGEKHDCSRFLRDNILQLNVYSEADQMSFLFIFCCTAKP